MTSYGADMKDDNKRVKISLTWSQRRAFVLSVLGFQALVWADALLNEGRFGGSWRTALVGLALIGAGNTLGLGMWWSRTALVRKAPWLR